MHPEISIIVPVYGVEKYIYDCICSIKRQTFKNFEVILVNDGTRDKSIEIALSVIGDDKRFVVINKKNGGQASARNLGLDNAKGKFIAFIDSDDVVENNYLELLYNKIVSTNSDICFCNVLFVDSNGNNVNTFLNNVDYYLKNRDYLISNYSVSNFVWDKLYNRKIFNNYRFNEALRSNEDVALVFKIIYGKKLTKVDEYLYRYYQRTNSTSKGVKSDFVEDRLKIIKEQKDFLLSNDIQLDKIYLTYTYLSSFVFSCALTIALYSNDYKRDIEKLMNSIDYDMFTFLNIFNVLKFNKKTFISLLIFKTSKLLFRYIVKIYFLKRNY